MSCPTYTFFESYLASWQEAYGPMPSSTPLDDKQWFWDKHGIMSSRAQIEASVSEPLRKTRFLAAVSPHSGDWLCRFPRVVCNLLTRQYARR